MVFERGACGDLTGWPPVLCLLRYLIVLSTIYRVRMCLSLGHSPSDVNMSMKEFQYQRACRWYVSKLVAAVVGNKRVRGYSKHRADAEDVPQ